MSELDLDELLEEVAVEPKSSEAARPSSDEHPNREIRYRKKLVRDWDSDAIKRHIEARLDLHHPPPITTWSFRNPTEIANEVFGPGEHSMKFLTRLGRTLAQITRERGVQGVRRQFREGRSRYLLPPVR